MIEPENIKWAALIIICVPAVLYYYWMRRLARKRNLESKCARCGKKIEKESQNTISNMTMCPGCLAQTSRNHKLAWVIFGMFGFILILELVVIIGDIRYGNPFGWDKLIMLIWPVYLLVYCLIKISDES